MQLFQHDGMCHREGLFKPCSNSQAAAGVKSRQDSL